MGLITSQQRAAGWISGLLALAAVAAPGILPGPDDLDQVGLGYCRTDSGLVHMAGVKADPDFPTGWAAQTGLVSLRNLYLGPHGAQLADSAQTLDVGNTPSTALRELSIAHRGSDRAIMLAQLTGYYTPLGANLELWDGGELVANMNKVRARFDEAQYSANEWNPTAVSSDTPLHFFGKFEGLDTVGGPHGVTVYVSSRVTGGDSNHVIEFDLPIMPQASPHLARVVGRGLAPRVDRDQLGRTWMVRMLSHGSYISPKPLQLSMKEPGGDWAPLVTPLDSIKASVDFDIAVSGDSLYIGVKHYPDHQGRRLVEGEPLALGLWRMDLTTGAWWALGIPESLHPDLGSPSPSTERRSVYLFGVGASPLPVLSGAPLAMIRCADGEFRDVRLGELEGTRLVQ